MNRGGVGEERGGKDMDRCPLTETLSFSYLRIILVLGVFQGLCGV
jgi:hypothetical protein